MMTKLTKEQRYEYQCYIWDAFKDINGIRPRFLNFDTMSDQEMVDMSDRLSDECDEQSVRERKYEQDIREALHDETAYVIVDPWYEEDGHTVEDAVMHGDFFMLSVYRPEPVPANNAIATAFRNQGD